ncbi:MAG: acyl carrier protein [Candidatus Aminicenantes bacterium]|nr:acyl carrier protein [Candidatus Aminicenantes bacterium]
MTKNEIAQKVREIIASKLTVEESKIVPDAKLIEDLGADSLDIPDLVADFEETFEIEIPDEDLEKIVTVGDIVNYIAKKKGL